MDLTIDRLTKQFGSKIAVDRVSTRLTPGVYGLLGANGAGKTTLMRIVCDVLRPTSGEIRFDGRDVRLLGDEYRARLGYLPQDFGYYPDFSALDFMCYLAALKGLDRRAARRRSLELLETVGLADVARQKVRTFSGGMKQRLGIAQAVLNDPAVLVLDGHAVVRVVADEAPVAGARALDPTLEDVYLYVFRDEVVPLS